MSTQPQAVIIVFKDDVPKEQVAKYADDIVENGGIVKNRYYEDGIINGISAIIPEQYLGSFMSFRADQIKYVEPDGIVTIQ